MLNLPVDYGKYDTGQAVVTTKDCKLTNIEGFGICTRTGEQCTPFLSEEWISDGPTIKVFSEEHIDDLPVPLADASAVCFKAQGGTIKVDNTGQKNNPNALTGKKKYKINEDENYDITIDENDEMCELEFKPSKTGYYNVNIQTKQIFLLDITYLGIGDFTSIDKKQNESPNFNINSILPLRENKKYSLGCYQSSGDFKCLVTGNIDTTTCYDTKITRIWSAIYPKPHPNKIVYFGAPEDPEEWFYKIVFIPKDEVANFIDVWRDVKSWIYNQNKKDETEDNTWWDNFWQGLGVFDIYDAITGVLGYAIQKGIIGILTAIGFTVAVGAEAAVTAIGVASGFLATYLMNSIGSKVDFNAVMDMFLEELKNAAGFRDKSSEVVQNGVKIVTKKKYLSYRPDHDTGAYSEHTYITSWYSECGEILQAEKYHHGSFSTIQTNQIAQLCSEICDESTSKSKNLTKEEIVVLGEKYQSLYPELDRQIEDYKLGYICSKFYVNKMEV